MIIGNRFVKLIFVVLGGIILAINLVFWANNNPQMLKPFIISYSGYQHFGDTNKFVGFKELFEYIETFPGISHSSYILNKYTNIISNYKVVDGGILDAIIAIFRLLTAPVLLSVTIVIDVFNNIRWFFNGIAWWGSTAL